MICEGFGREHRIYEGKVKNQKFHIAKLDYRIGVVEWNELQVTLLNEALIPTVACFCRLHNLFNYKGARMETKKQVRLYRIWCK